MGRFAAIFSPTPPASPAMGSPWASEPDWPGEGWSGVAGWWVGPNGERRQRASSALSGVGLPDTALTDPEVEERGGAISQGLRQAGGSLATALADIPVGVTVAATAVNEMNPLSVAEDVIERATGYELPTRDLRRGQAEALRGFARRHTADLRAGGQEMLPPQSSIREEPLRAIGLGAVGAVPEIAAVAATGPAGLAAVGTRIAGSIYDDLLGKGVSETTAAQAATAAAGGGLALERIGGRAVLGQLGNLGGLTPRAMGAFLRDLATGGARSAVTRTAGAGAGEMATEVSQEILTMAAEAAVGVAPTPDEAIERVLTSASVGATVGGGIRGAFEAPAAVMRRRAGKGSEAIVPETEPHGPLPDDAPVGQRFLHHLNGLRREFFTADRGLGTQILRIMEESGGQQQEDSLAMDFAAANYRFARKAFVKASGLSRAEVDELAHRYITRSDLRDRQVAGRLEESAEGRTGELAARLRRIAERRADRARGTDALPEEVKAVLDKQRRIIDEHSLGLLGLPEGILPEGLKATIEGNLGSYQGRYYSFIDDPDHRARIRGTEIEEKALRFLRRELQGEGVPEAELDARARGELDAMLTPPDDNPFVVFARPQSSGLTAGPQTLDSSVRLRRKDIPPELREVMGEIYDPAVAGLKTVERISRTRRKAEMYQAIRDAGWGSIFHENATGPFSAEMSGEAFARSPLGGSYTTPHIKALIERTFDETHQSSILGIVNGTVKLTATAGSVQSQFRNPASNTMPMALNGNLLPLPVPGPDGWTIANEGGKALIEGFRVGKAGLFGSKNPDLQAKALQQARMGISGTSVDAGDLEMYFGKSAPASARSAKETANLVLKGLVNPRALLEATKKARPVMESKAKRTIRHPFKTAQRVIGQNPVTRFATKAYKLGDDPFKWAFAKNERQKYAWALGKDVDDPEVTAIGAELTKNLMQNYDRSSKAVDTLAKSPFFGPFVRFPASVLRNTYHTAAQVSREIQHPNPKVQWIGWHRLASAMATMSSPAAAVALADLSPAVDDWDDEDDRLLRVFLPPWMKNGVNVPTEVDPGNKVSVLDGSYLDYYSILRKPFLAAALSPDRQEDPFRQAAIEMAEQLFGQELGFGTMVDLMENRDEYQRPIYDPKGGADGIFLDIGAYGVDEMMLGTPKTVQRNWMAWTGQTRGSRVYDRGEEALAIVGPRSWSIDLREAMTGIGASFSRNLRDASSTMTARSKGGTLGDERLTRAARDLPGKLARSYQEMQDALDAARHFGLDEEEALQYAKLGGASGKQLNLLLDLGIEEAAKIRQREIFDNALEARAADYENRWRGWRRKNDLATPSQIARERQRFEKQWGALWDILGDGEPWDLDLR